MKVKDLIGCKIRTHYGTGGVVTWVRGEPFQNGQYTINYKVRPEHRDYCIINSITERGGVIYCEGIPLQIEGQSDWALQLSLF